LPMMTPSVVARAPVCAAKCAGCLDMMGSACVKEGDPYARIVLRSSAANFSASLRKSFANQRRPSQKAMFSDEKWGR